MLYSTANWETFNHNNHIVWELYGDEDKIGISFNHARYNENWNKIEESLFQWGFDKNGRDEKALVPNREGSIGMLYCSCTAQEYCTDPTNFVKETYKLVMDMMSVFFAPKQKVDFDYFKKSDTKYKKNYAEKRWQQKLFMDLKFCKTGLFAYDLEFSQPKGAKQSESNEPDILALRYEKGVPVAIVLVEVKSLASACRPNTNSKSDILSHIRGMKAYSKSKNISQRRKEVHDVLTYYEELGLYVKDGQVIPDSDNELPVECVLIFTSADLVDIGYSIPSSKSAIHYYLNNKKEIDSYVNEDGWKCEVICVGHFEKNRRYESNDYSLPTEWE